MISYFGYLMETECETKKDKFKVHMGEFLRLGCSTRNFVCNLCRRYVILARINERSNDVSIGM